MIVATGPDNEGNKVYTKLREHGTVITHGSYTSTLVNEPKAYFGCV